MQTAGDLDLKSGGTIPNMLIVNMDRLFLGKGSRKLTVLSFDPSRTKIVAQKIEGTYFFSIDVIPNNKDRLFLGSYCQQVQTIPR